MKLLENRRRLCAGLLSAALCVSLAACGQAGGSVPASGNTPLGRWVETEVTPAAFARADDSPILAASENGGPMLCADGALYRSEDGGLTWARDPALGDPDTLRVMAVTQDGTALLEDRETRTVYLQRPGEEPAELDLSGIEGFACLSRAMALDNDTLLLYPTLQQTLGGGFTISGGISLGGAFTSVQETDENGDTVVYAGAQAFYLYNLADGTLEEVPFASDPAMAPSLSTLFAAAGEPEYITNGSLVCLERSGQARVLLEELPGTNRGRAAAAVGSDGAFYYACEDGLYRVGPGGTLPEMLFEAAGTVLADGQTPWSLLCLEDGSLLLLTLASDGAPRLYRYAFDETLPAPGSAGTLTLWTLYDNANARAAVNVFAKTNPEKAVDLTIALPDADPDEPDAQAVNDAVTRLNTELLAGGGPDVLLLDGLDLQSLLQKGLLADLSGAVGADTLVPFVSAGFATEDGALYTLPARFSMPVLFGDADEPALRGLSDLAALQKEILACPPRADIPHGHEDYYTALPDGQKFALDFARPADLCDYLLDTSGAVLLQDGALNEAALRELFTFADAVVRHYGMNAYDREGMQRENSSGMGVFVAMPDGSFSLEGQQWVTLTDRALRYTQCSNAKYGWELMRTPLLAIHCARYEDNTLSAGGRRVQVPVEILPAPGLCEGAWLPAVLVGVNAASADPDGALALASAFFGSEVQNTPCGDGMPVCAEVLQAQIKDALAQSAGNGYSGDLTALLAACRTPVLVPQPLRAAVEKHIEALVFGEEDLTAAIEGVRADTALWLAER